jgi:hypothetical protein
MAIFVSVFAVAAHRVTLTLYLPFLVQLTLNRFRIAQVSLLLEAPSA